MSPKNTLDGLGDAFDKAADEVGWVEPTDGFELTPPTQEPAPAEVEPEVEQVSQEPNEQVPQKLSDLAKLEQTSEEESEELTPDSLIEVQGIGQITIRELQDGYLRQSDYTRKTQEIAELRRGFEARQAETANVTKLYDMLQEDAQGTIARLAYEAGLIEQVPGQIPQGQGDPIANVVADDSERIAEIVAEQVQQALAQDQTVATVRKQQRIASLNAQLDGLGNTYGISLDNDDKIAIANRAMADKESNLELVFLRMQKELQTAQDSVERVKAAAPKSRKETIPQRSGERAKSVREAMALAEQVLAKGG